MEGARFAVAEQIGDLVDGVLRVVEPRFGQFPPDLLEDLAKRGALGSQAPTEGSLAHTQLARGLIPAGQARRYPFDQQRAHALTGVAAALWPAQGLQSGFDQPHERRPQRLLGADHR